ncbi:hypothetical protein AAGS40_24305 [Paraburkholderia sp. PREW-6R]|uniref:hypothetical protein n=1 Tax=Paraburkholderia sp. PREW-6R TaxID=3141544 RepID=UPI0031F54D2D
MKFQLTTLVCVLAFTGCADHAARERLGIVDSTVLKSGMGASQDEAAGAPSPQWVSAYASIRRSLGALASLQQRLDQLPRDRREYFHAKAQCWLNAAQQARADRDLWGFVEEALGQAAVITIGLQNSASLSAANPALRTVSTVRPDLWDIVNAIKADPAVARCPHAQAPLACAEVELMHAGHDAWRRNFSASESRLPHIKDSLRASAETALHCEQAASARVSFSRQAAAPAS